MYSTHWTRSTRSATERGLAWARRRLGRAEDTSWGSRRLSERAGPPRPLRVIDGAHVFGGPMLGGSRWVGHAGWVMLGGPRWVGHAGWARLGGPRSARAGLPYAGRV